jgi:glycerophosphoryl diester phosphodiesterase
MAHRGGSLLESNLGRENTLHAFRAAAALGYHYIETDIQATRDGEIVIFHDQTLDRLTGASGTVFERTAADLTHLTVGGEPIPTLDQVLDEFPTIRFNIDLKAQGTVEPLIRILARHRAGQRVLVDSFSQQRLSRFRALTRGLIPTAVGPSGIAWAAFVPTLPQLLASPGVALQIPLDYPLGPAQATTFSPRTVTNAHRAGRVVHVWTIDDAATMDTVIDAGADGVMTDRPDILKAVLQRRGLWEVDDE